jgi:hypothetical protein
MLGAGGAPRALREEDRAAGEEGMAKAKQLVIEVADRPGSLADAIEALAESRVNILSVLAWNPGGVAHVVTDNPRKAKKALDGAGVRYTEMEGNVTELPHAPGALVKHLRGLAKKGVNLHSVCASSAKGARKATVVWSVEEK